MTTKQTGHSQNVTNLGLLISRITTFAGYHPPREELTIESLNLLKTKGESVIDEVTQAKTNFKNAVTVRSMAFEGFDALVTCIDNALQISGAPAQTIAQGAGLMRQLHGKKSANKPSDEEILLAKENGKEIRVVTLHNATFDSRIANFNSVIQFLSTIPEYKPNERELTVAALKIKHTAQKSAHESYNQKEAQLTASRILRDDFLYKEATGLVPIATDVKKYVKSAYTNSSSQFKQISDIAFKSI